MPPLDVIIIRIALAFALGAIIGAEREYLSKSAGLRTLILISTGSCLFTLISIAISDLSSDRIASNIVTGIGFLGAGVIFQTGNRVNGLTTAATIWSVAALGMSVGAGYYAAAGIACGLIIFTLVLLNYFEDWIDHFNETHTYRIVCDYSPELLARFENLFYQNHLQFHKDKQTRSGKKYTGTWTVSGKKRNHDQFIQQILKDESVDEFDF
jgi:putative Mg2+ transporter-C (MgtC) family protein